MTVNSSSKARHRVRLLADLEGFFVKDPAARVELNQYEPFGDAFSQSPFSRFLSSALESSSYLFQGGALLRLVERYLTEQGCVDLLKGKRLSTPQGGPGASARGGM
jgi:hypothetical protein